MKYKLFIIVGSLVAVIIIIGIIEGLIIKYNGTNVPAPQTPRAAENYGSSGSAVTYVVLGDSTSVGQGGDYDHGIARTTARYIARSHQVTFYNLGVSGARSADVLHKQLPTAVRLQPDVVLIAIGANDVTHLTKLASVKTSLQQIIHDLQAANPRVQIVLTGSPQMGAVPRFPWPVSAYAGHRTARVNSVIAAVASSHCAILAPIAAKTGATFAAHPELFAQDKFHPNTNGYSVWIPVLEQALDTALRRQP